MAATRAAEGRSKQALISSSLGVGLVLAASAVRGWPFRRKGRPTLDDSVNRERTSSKRGMPGRRMPRAERSLLEEEGAGS